MTKINLFELYASLTLDTEGYERGLDEAGTKTSSFGSKLKSGLATAAKVGGMALSAAAAGIAAITTQSINQYSEYEQLVGGVETLFGDSADAVMDYANNAFKSAGMSANEYMATVTSFSASLLQSLGGDTAAAAKYADQAITDMSDNANKMGSDIASIQNAYQGFAKQNYTMLDNLKLGYGGTKEEMERLLADAEAIAGVDFDISSYADVVEAIHVIQTEMGITGTTAREASSTIQGSVSAMKAAWNNFLVGMADPTQDFDALMSNLVDSVVTVGENIIPRILGLLPQIARGLSTLVESAVPMIGPLMRQILPELISGASAILSSLASVLPDLLEAALSALPDLASAALSLISQFGTAIREAAPQLLETGMSVLGELVNGIIEGLPDMIARLPQVIDEFLNFISANLPTILKQGTDMLAKLASGIISAIPKLVSQLPKIISSIVDFITSNLPLLVESGISLTIQLVAGILQAIPQLVAAAPQLIAALVQGVGSLMGSVVEIGVNIVNGVWQGIQSMLGEFTRKVKDFFSGIVDGVKNVLGIKSPSRVFAEIGGFMAEGLSEGWDDEYTHIKKSIEDDMKFGTANVGISAVDRQTQAISGLTGAMLAGANNGGTYEIIVRVGDSDLANVLFDPLRGVATQRGESFA